MGVTKELVIKLEQEYDKNPANYVIEAAIAKVGLSEAATNQDSIRRHDFQFSDKTLRGQMTNQKASGRCWIFAALNAARVAAMKKHNIESLEFSQTYIFFWDKLERSNYFLESIIETVQEELTSRLLAHLLATPIQDGGQWDMVAGLFEKYGIVPKEAMPDTFHSTASADLNKLLNSYLRYFALEIRKAAANGATTAELKDLKEKQLSTVYNLLVKAFGKPPVKVRYEFENKEKEFCRLPEMTPQDFFAEMVGWKLEDKISVINAPTEDKPYGRAYTVKFLGSIKGLRPICYVNTPIEVLKSAAIAAIKDGEPVWFGCDMGQQIGRDNGLMDHELYRFETVVGTMLPWTKGERLTHGESCLTHAMVFTGVNLDDEGNPINWQVENSWGKERGQEGVFSMSDQWFSEFVYQIMIDKKYVDAKWLEALTQPVIELEPWDPIGTLA
ncbi:aminopeptidase [Clostridiales bacterium COT073_COT-073]|nr:aminopeptidase [Clostridiales bacterium COT073_COT-073]